MYRKLDWFSGERERDDVLSILYIRQIDTHKVQNKIQLLPNHAAIKLLTSSIFRYRSSPFHG